MCDIFNAEEKWLFFKVLPNKFIVFKTINTVDKKFKKKIELSPYVTTR